MFHYNQDLPCCVILWPTAHVACCYVQQCIAGSPATMLHSWHTTWTVLIVRLCQTCTLFAHNAETCFSWTCRGYVYTATVILRYNAVGCLHKILMRTQ